MVFVRRFGGAGAEVMPSIVALLPVLAVVEGFVWPHRCNCPALSVSGERDDVMTENQIRVRVIRVIERSVLGFLDRSRITGVIKKPADMRDA